jgi:hypothetical protein
MRSIQVCTIVAVIAAICVVSQMQSRTMPEDSSVSYVCVSDIGKSVTLIGYLGAPLGKNLTVRGKWSMPAKSVKDFSPRFTVIEVDGKPLKEPFEFNIAQIKATTADGKNALPLRENQKTLEGLEWTMTAYESGFYGGDPGLTQVPVQKPYYMREFTPQLVGRLVKK